MSGLFEFGTYRLRKAELKDAQGFIQISADWDVMRYYGEGGGVCKTMDDAEKQIAWCHRTFRENAGRWIITEKQNDEYIGDIGYSEFVETHKRAEIGYRLMKQYWGRGIISAFLHQLVGWGFSDLGYNRIEAQVDVRNEGSKRVLVKNGFSLEGVLRQYEFEHGGFVDLEVYSILKDEYLGQRGV